MQANPSAEDGSGVNSVAVTVIPAVRASDQNRRRHGSPAAARDRP